MQQLIIDRSKWRTGGSVLNKDLKYGKTQLLNTQGMMCCLGFYCEQIENLPKERLLGISDPQGFDDFYEESILINNHYRDQRLLINSEFTDNAININDDGDISSEEREKTIIKHFKTVDVEVIFKNEYI